MPKKRLTYESAYSSSYCDENEKLFFADTPLIMRSFSFVESSYDKRNDVDDEEIVSDELHKIL